MNPQYVKTAGSPTACALAFEQAGMWSEAQIMYEQCQLQARKRTLAWSESELMLWEDHWVNCAMKLQQWDILGDLAKLEGNKELALEALWRTQTDWFQNREEIQQQIQSMDSTPSPRRRLFEAYLLLIEGYEVQSRLRNESLKLTQLASQQSTQPTNLPEEMKAELYKLQKDSLEVRVKYSQTYDNAQRQAIQKWNALPGVVSPAHVPLLQVFQLLVELHEAQSIFRILVETDAQNFEARSTEVRNMLTTWRDRLPNLWDDINIWSDLVHWRQHIFTAVNRAYLPLAAAMPVQSVPAGALANNNQSQAYRGYHETAWIVNRFAQVARKHKLIEVCQASLTKIYTLPNIEIQEAFLKLREQAKCHHNNPNEIPQAVEVINNTNLVYFTAPQKAEFFTLKAMFFAALGLHDEAMHVFQQSVGMDNSFPKAWAEWGEYHDRLFQDNPDDYARAGEAVTCYLNAAGIYKSAKSRKILVRIIWLLSIDSSQHNIANSVMEFKGDVPVWYWITFIPQLFQLLSSSQPRPAKRILAKIAVVFPQALFFSLRTVIEELRPPEQYPSAPTPDPNRPTPASSQPGSQDVEMKDVEMKNTDPNQASTSSSTSQAMIAPPTSIPQPSPIPSHHSPHLTQGPSSSPIPNGPPPTGEEAAAMANSSQSSHPWEHADEVMAMLKTAFPLLALTMEFIVDQIHQRFRAPDEGFYGAVTKMHRDSLRELVQKGVRGVDDDQPSRELLMALGGLFKGQFHIKSKDALIRQFAEARNSLRRLIEVLAKQLHRHEGDLARQGKHRNLEGVSHWLVEFQYQRFDEIEVPGQYLQHVDANTNFVRIDHFASRFDVFRTSGQHYRRLTMIGHNGMQYPFAVNLPSPTTARREEKFMQFFRLLNGPLSKRIESRRRNLSFHVPVVVPLAAHLRLYEFDQSTISLQDVHENFSQQLGIEVYDAVHIQIERVRELTATQPELVANPELLNIARVEIGEEIQAKTLPDTILKKYMARIMPDALSLWYLRKEFTCHFASVMFATHLLAVGDRHPGRIVFSRSHGHVYTSELLPTISDEVPELSNKERVPFRFTPNLQQFITPVGIEGPLVSSLMAFARCLTEHPYDIEHRLSIFMRDEVLLWVDRHQKPFTDNAVRDVTLKNVATAVSHARLMACKMERERAPNGLIPVNQSILELISLATNPFRLASMDPLWMPWL